MPETDSAKPGSRPRLATWLKNVLAWLMTQRLEAVGNEGAKGWPNSHVVSGSYYSGENIYS